ncbi:MAG: phosphopantothenoylcysteine decarboxylase [Phycisphaerales bacterium]|nr:phosphopantothenoylcysteine decarboxylase [Phycisphaerales bacterium]
MPVAQDQSPRRSITHLLVTAGPTHEPIDSVRFLGNRSSGRLGVSLADQAAQRGWDVTLLLGPVSILPTDSRVRLRRFRTAADLQGLLREEMTRATILIMAAAVADYRPLDGASPGKIRRTADNLRLELEPTPDLLAEVAQSRTPGQFLVGFALEPRERMRASAAEKLARKNVDMIVANPLETMDSATIEALVLQANGVENFTQGAIDKTEFGSWLLTLIEQAAGKDAR